VKLFIYTLSACFALSSFSYTLQTESHEELAFQVTALFRAYRKTIATNKEAIHNTKTYFKNPAKRVTEMAIMAKTYYEEMTGKKLPEDRVSRTGKVKYLLEKAVRNVIFGVADGIYDLNWTGSNEYVRKWDGKLLPARFANRVANQFNILTNNKYRIKLTTSKQLIVNENNMPDSWESEVIDTHLLHTTKSQFKTRSIINKGFYRYILPEFYGPSCIGCHGTNEGQEGEYIHPSKLKRQLNDFAGAISISIRL